MIRLSRFRHAGLAPLAAAALLLGSCGADSPEDAARDAGRAIGEAVGDIEQSAQNIDVRSQLDDVERELDQLQDDLSSSADRQVEQIGDDLRREVEEAGEDQNEVREAFSRARERLEALGSETDSVVNELRRGVEQGYDDAAGGG